MPGFQREPADPRTCLIDASANRRAVFSERGLRLIDWSGSKGGPFKAPRTVERSNGGTEGGLEGLILLVPFRNLTTRSFLTNDWPATRTWCAAMAATYTLSVDGERPASNSFCRNERTTNILYAFYGEKSWSVFIKNLNLFSTEERKTWTSWMTWGWVNYQHFFFF